MHRISDIGDALDRVDSLDQTLVSPLDDESRQDEAAGIDSLTLDASPPGDRALPALAPIESTSHRALWVGVMLAIGALYAFALFSFWAPADGGVDQNAYLVGGKQLALTGSTGVHPSSPFQYVGHMFVVPEKGDGFYPKYPFGLPLLYAAVIKAFGWSRGIEYAFGVSPACAVLAVVGMFFLARAVAGSFAGVLAAIALAGSEVMWKLANVANSHASCVAFVVWGMCLLVWWWQRGAAWRGLLAGFLLGFACLIRYTEGLLIIPIVLAVAFRIRWRDWRSYLRSAAPIVGWLIPVAALFIFNRMTIGDWTGYDSSNESEIGKAFTWEKFADTWEQMLRTFHDQGLFFIVPLGVAGLVMLFGKSWRLGLVLAAWLVPGTMLYTSYYWSPDRGVAYARFFLTFFPALLVGLAVFVRVIADHDDRSLAAQIAKRLAAGLVVAIAVGVGTWRVVQVDLADGARGAGGMGGTMLAQFRNRSSLATVGRILDQSVPSGSVVFGDEGRMFDGPLNYLQFAGRWELYSIDAFQNRGLRMAGRGGGPFGGNADNPTPMQPRRREHMMDAYRGKSDRDLLAEQRRITDAALDANQRVFLVGSSNNVDSVKRRFFPADKYKLVIVQRWRDVPEPRDWSDSSGSTESTRRRVAGMFGPGRRGGPGGGGGGAMPQLFGDDSPTNWVLIEVQRAPAAPSPTTRELQPGLVDSAR